MEVALAVAMLAGYAVDRLLSEEAREDAKFIARWAVIASLALASLCIVAGGFVLWGNAAAESLIRSLAGLRQLPAGFLEHAGAEFYVPMITNFCACGAIIAFVRRRGHAYWLLLAFLLVDFNLYAAFAPIGNPAKLETLVGRAMPNSLANKQSEREPIRYHVMLNPLTGEFNPFWFYGHEMATGYDPILNERGKVFLGMDEAGRTFNSTMLEPQDRTLDLLNVRYVFVPPDAPARGDAGEQVDLKRGQSAVFKTGESAVDSLTVISSLSNSIEIENGETVARVSIACESGARWTAPLRAGQETAEWAYDRADVRSIIKHSRARIAESRSGDARGSFQAHSYIARFTLPRELSACSAARTVEIAASPRDGASLTLHRIALNDSTSGRPVVLARSVAGALSDAARWRELTERSEAPPYRDYRIYENLRAMPRAWLVDRVVVDWEGDQHKKIRGQIEGFDPRIVALVDHATAARLNPTLTRRADELRAIEPEVINVNILSREPARMLIEANAAMPSMLILSEIFYPGWRVRVDGRDAEPLRVNYNLRGIELAAGRHRIEMSYKPKSVVVGAAVTITTALCLLAIWMWDRRRFRVAVALASPLGLPF
jgi:hypothetical protein